MMPDLTALHGVTPRGWSLIYLRPWCWIAHRYDWEIVTVGDSWQVRFVRCWKCSLLWGAR